MFREYIFLATLLYDTHSTEFIKLGCSKSRRGGLAVKEVLLLFQKIHAWFPGPSLTEQFTTTWTPALGDLMPALGPLRAPAHNTQSTHRHIYTFVGRGRTISSMFVDTLTSLLTEVHLWPAVPTAANKADGRTRQRSASSKA